jgi:hypothetical protein
MEARWAVFLDEMDVAWTYEQDGFDLAPLPTSTIRKRLGYQPDFHLTGLGKWMEYKPVWPTEEEFEKARRLAVLTGESVVFFYGSMDSPDFRNKNKGNGILVKPSLEEEQNYWWCHCPKCDRVGLERWGNAARIFCGCGHFKPEDLFDNVDGRHHQFNTQRLIDAYTLARNYHFIGTNPGEKNNGIR